MSAQNEVWKKFPGLSAIFFFTLGQILSNFLHMSKAYKFTMGSLAIVLTSGIASAQTISSPLGLGGLNANVIANGFTSAGLNTPIDGTDVLYDSSYATVHGITGGALQTSTAFTNSSGVLYVLPAAGANNGLLINSTSPLTLTFASAGDVSTLYLLGTSSGAPLLTFTLLFAGGIDSAPISASFPDWYSVTSGPGDVNGLGRVGTVGLATDVYDPTGGNNFSLYTVALPIPVADQSLTLEGVSIALDPADTSGSAVVLAASASPVPEPTPLLLAAAGVGLLAVLRRRS